MVSIEIEVSADVAANIIAEYKPLVAPHIGKNLRQRAGRWYVTVPGDHFTIGPTGPDRMVSVGSTGVERYAPAPRWFE